MKSNDEYWMRRAIALARKGHGHVSPNPAVGCVIVAADGSIAGEGWHRRYGEGHAEVNAVASVRDRELLKDATVYVTLEPCSHQGKTPPCARLLMSLPIRRVVAGSVDPNPKVAGRGLEMLRQAGKEVTLGVLEAECRAVNPAFLTAQELGRPYITLKWACSADGAMGSKSGRLHFSEAQGMVWCHRERALHDAILAGRDTVIADNPRLDLRRCPGRNPRPVVIGGDGTPLPGTHLSENPDTLWLPHADDLRQVMESLWREHHLSSVLVEGGSRLLRAFIEAGLYDRIRVETSPARPDANPLTDIAAPAIPADVLHESAMHLGANRVDTFVRKPANMLRTDSQALKKD